MKKKVYGVEKREIMVRVLERRAKQKLGIVVKLVKGDSCPDCGERLEWNEGDQVHCDSCGSEYDVDWSRMLEDDDS